MSNDKTYRLLGLFFLSMVLFNFPIINLFSEARLVAGVPLLYLFVFVAWALVILLTLRFVQSDGKSR